jgi:hypothetical protein
MNVRRALSSLLVVFAFNGLSLWAQFTSAIEGTVSDPSGAVVPGASVTLKNEDTGATRSTETTVAGYYRFPSLPAARFSLRVSAAGFKTHVQENIRLQAAEIQTVNFVLELGTTATEVTVSAAPPPVELAEGRVSGHIDESKIRDIPLSGRNFFNLVVLTPGVTGLASGGGQAYAQATGDIFNNEYGVNLNANGQRAESNNFLVDSASVTSSQRNGVANVTPNAENVQEVRVSVNNFSAEYGRNAAALVNIITKQGTNDWHGSLAFFHTNNRLQARNIFQRPSGPVFRRNEGAWSLGGPIRKDQTFVFGTMDILRSAVGTGRAATVATPQFIQFMDQNHPNNISTFIWKNFPTSVVPTGSFRTAGDMAGVDCSTLGSPSDSINTQVGAIPCDFPVTGVGGFSSSLPRDGLQYTARMDHSFNDSKDRLYASFNRMTLDQVLFGNPSVYPKFDTIQPSYSMHGNLNWTHTFSPTLVNEFSTSAIRVFGDALVNNPEVPGITVTGIEPIQTGWGPNAFVQNNFEWRDVASLVRGRHSLKIGGSVTRERADHESSRVFLRPMYSFNSVFDFATDTPFQQSNIGFNPVTGERVVPLFSLIRTGSTAVFVQDDWKVTPSLTVNLGFRWENFWNPTEAECDQCISFLRFQGGDDFPSRIANAKVDLGKNLLDHSLHNFSPRFGFAWDPTGAGKMSVRGGFGLFYDRYSNQLFDGEFTNLPTLANAVARADTAFAPVFALGTSSSPPYGFPIPPGIQTGLDERNGLLNGRATVTVADPNLKASYSQNWFFGIQRALSNNWVVEANYIGSVGRRGYVRYNVNRFPGDKIINQGNFTGLQPGFQDIIYGQSRESSSYNGGTLAVKKRYTRGFSFDAAYTIGKAVDYTSRLDGGNYRDPFDPRGMRGLADFDIRQRLVFSTVWQLPSPQSDSALLRGFLGGWQVTNITILQSGSPFTVFCDDTFRPVFDANNNVIGNTGCDFNADGFNNDVPNQPTSGNSLSGLKRSDYLTGIFTNTVFPLPEFPNVGDLGRNTYFGPGYYNTDFSLIKNTKIPWMVGNEGANMQWRFEFFNLFNRVNLTNPSGQMNNPSRFGRSFTAYGARNIQFALRISF